MYLTKLCLQCMKIIDLKCDVKLVYASVWSDSFFMFYAIPKIGPAKLVVYYFLLLNHEPVNIAPVVLVLTGD